MDDRWPCDQVFNSNRRGCRGGASAIFALFGLLPGLAGTAVHGLLAFWKHRQKASLLWPMFSLALFSYLYIAEQSCIYTSQEARQMVISRLVKYKKSKGTLGGLGPQYPGEANITPQSCTYDFLHDGNGRKLKLIFDRGKLFFDDLNEP